mgnify:CR=1 FL=1
MKKIISFIIVLLCSVAYADIPDIVAIVNDKPITKYDFESRKNMVISINNIDVSNSTINARLNQDILNILIEEELLNQHIAKIGKVISPEEIDSAIKSIEQQQGMQKGGTHQYLNEKGIDVSSFRKQIRGELIKNQLFNSLSHGISVSEEEMQFVAITNANQDLNVEAWVFTSRGGDREFLKQMKKLRTKLQSCDKISDKLYKEFAEGKRFNQNLKEMPNNTRSVVSDTRVNSSSAVYREGGKFKLIFVCKKDCIASDSDFKNIRSFLSNKKMSQKAQKFLKDMKARAYIQKMI